MSEEVQQRLEHLSVCSEHEKDPVHLIIDKIYNQFRIENEDGTLEDRVDFPAFLKAIESRGIRISDPRLAMLNANIEEFQDLQLSSKSDKQTELDHLVFSGIIKDDIVFINKILDNNLVIPDFPRFTDAITELYNECKDNHGGKNADYIPQLATFDPNYWGVSVCTTDGQRFSIGDCNIPFTMQSTTKPLTYGIGLTEYDAKHVHSFIGQEPSGIAFNEIKLDSAGKPHNPMINAGAIMAAAICKPELSQGDRFDWIHGQFKKLAGGEHLSFNNSIFLSERENADRNNCLAYFMKGAGCYEKDPNCKDQVNKFKESLELYFMLCSQEVTADSCSVMAATLANGGIVPTTEERVYKGDMVKHILSLMLSCGMYDYSGQYAFNVGVPAKSGVGGSLMIVIPNLCGICVWSPPLDEHGNSVRGVDFSTRMVEKFNFHIFDTIRSEKNSKKLDPRINPNEQRNIAIVNVLFAAKAGDLSALQTYYRQGADMGAADYDNRTALHLAAEEGHSRCVKFLVEECKVDFEPLDRWGTTPEDCAKNHPLVLKRFQKYKTEKPNIPEAIQE